MPRNFIHEADESSFIEYAENNYDVQNMVQQFGEEAGREKVFNNAKFRDFHKNLFEDGVWPYNMQNDTLFMLLYSCAGRDKYIDGGIDSIFRTLSENPPTERRAQNEFLDYVYKTLERYAPFDAGVRTLCDYVEFAIHSNTVELQKDIPNYQFPELTEEAKAARDFERNNLFIEYMGIKDRLESNGWDFTNKDDEEFIRTLIDLRIKEPTTGGPIFEHFMNKAMSAHVYNIVDKDNLYKSVQDYLHETHLEEYQNTNDLKGYINFVREGNAKQVQEVAEMNEQTTDLFQIINEIGNTSNKRSDIHNLMSYEEGDKTFYEAQFVNEADFAQADKVFDGIYGGVIEEQKKTSVKFSEMSEIDKLANTFKIMKAGAAEPMNLKESVKQRLISAGRFRDEEEAGVLPNELAARKAANEKDMATLAKLYILHEMQNRETKIVYEAYFGDKQYTRNDRVAEYLDINHPKIVRARDLESHKLQHDQNILDHFGQDQGMLYEENYNQYVMGALLDKQVIKLANPDKTIRGMSYTEARERLVANGWDIQNNPVEENYLIMLFNSHDPMNPYHNEIEEGLDMMLNSDAHGYNNRNEILRNIYNTVKVHREADLTIGALCDYILEDVKQTAQLEARDKVNSAEYTPAGDLNKYINGMNVLQIKDTMNANGWEIDPRIDILINRLYNSYDPQYPSAAAIEQCVGMLANMPADVSLDQINQLFSDMRQVIAPYKHNDEFINNIDEYLFDLTAEINAMKVVDMGDQGMVQTAMQYYKKNVSTRKITTNENNIIDDVNGIGELHDDITKENFVYATDDDFYWSEDYNIDLNNDGNNNMYDRQNIEAMFPESKRYAIAYNEYHFNKERMLEELSDSSGKLLKTAKQQGKELGEDGSGTDLYKDMASKLKVCIQKLQNPESRAGEIRLALQEFEKAAQTYKKERDSIFGKRGDGKTRFDVAAKYADGRISEMIYNFDKTLKSLEKTGKEVRANIDINALTDRELGFESGRALGINEEARIPKMKKSNIEASYNRMNELSKAQAKVKRQLEERKNQDPATNVIGDIYYNEAMKSDVSLDKVRQLSEKLSNKTFDNEVAALKKSKVFAKIVQENPKNYGKVWKNINKAGAELHYSSREYIDVTRTMFDKFDNDGNVIGKGSLIDYVIPDGQALDKAADPEKYDLTYKRMAQVVATQIAATNEEFARGIVVKALNEKSNTHDIMMKLRDEVEVHLKESKVLEGKNFDMTKLGKEIDNGFFTKKAVIGLAQKTSAESKKNVDANKPKTKTEDKGIRK